MNLRTRRLMAKLALEGVIFVVLVVVGYLIFAMTGPVG